MNAVKLNHHHYIYTSEPSRPRRTRRNPDDNDPLGVYELQSHMQNTLFILTSQLVGGSKL